MATRTQRTDPLRNFKFTVRFTPIGPALTNYLTGIGDLGFAQVGGLSVQNELIAYREGGMNTHPHKMVGQSDFPAVSFARGAFASQDQLWKWTKFMHAWVGGTGTEGFDQGAKGDETNYRCDVTVKVYDHPYTASGVQYQYDNTADRNVIPGNVKLAFRLYNCWPGAYGLSDLNAGDNGIMSQQMNLHHEGFQIAWQPEEISALTGEQALLA